MREIKFRAYVRNNERLRENFEKEYKELFPNSNGKFVLDVLAIDWNNEIVDLEYGNIEIPFEDVELLQYTGIKLEGEEVYEGDIISDEDCFLAVVEFNNGSFKANNNGYLDEIEEYGDVLGNIYETPELLKGENR